MQIRRALGLGLLVLVLAPAAWHVRTLAAILGARLSHPMDFEWMESGHLYQAYRVAHGLPLYIDPARGFAPFPYPPLFWIVVAGAGRIFGLDYATGRAVSVASLSGAILILSLAIARKAPARWIGVAFGLVAAASVGAAYPLTGGSFDLVRSDTMATFFPILAAALASDGRVARGRSVALVAALVLSLYAKQTNVFFVAWILLFVVIRDRRHGLRLAGATFAIALAIFLALEIGTGGWFAIWIFDMSHHAIEWERWADPFALFLRHAPFLFFLPLLVGWLRWQRALAPGSVKWVGMLATAVVGALLAHVKRGGWVNVYIPVFVLAWPVTLYVLCDALQRKSPALAWSSVVAANLLLCTLGYRADAFFPSDRDRREAERFHDFVRALDGEVVITIDAFAAIRDGKHCTQPMLQAYVDAANAHIPIDYVAALEGSGARFIITTHSEFETDLPVALTRAFEHTETFDVHAGPLGDHLEVWRRR